MNRATWFIGALGLTVGVILSATFGALADGDPTTDTVPRTLPYQGQLELDGVPVNASGADALHILFALYDGQDAEEPAYTQQIQVDVFAGRFIATIGPLGRNALDEEIEITSVITAADDLYLGMTLLGDPNDPDDDIALNNRQRIHASPYAMWTTAATNFAVARDAVVGRDLDIERNLSVGGELTLPVGAIDTADIEDGTLEFADLNESILGTGIDGDEGAIGVDDAYLNSRIRAYVRSNCQIQIGHRDNCGNCGSGPSRHATVQANNTCVGGSGGSSRCRGNFGGINFSGDVDGNDVIYIRFECD